MYQPMYNFAIGEKVKFSEDGDIFLIKKWTYETHLESVRDVVIELENLSEEEEPSYCHPLSRAKVVPE